MELPTDPVNSTYAMADITTLTGLARSRGIPVQESPIESPLKYRHRLIGHLEDLDRDLDRLVDIYDRDSPTSHEELEDLGYNLGIESWALPSDYSIYSTIQTYANGTIDPKSLTPDGRLTFQYFQESRNPSAKLPTRAQIDAMTIPKLVQFLTSVGIPTRGRLLKAQYRALAYEAIKAALPSRGVDSAVVDAVRFAIEQDPVEAAYQRAGSRSLDPADLYQDILNRVYYLRSTPGDAVNPIEVILRSSRPDDLAGRVIDAMKIGLQTPADLIGRINLLWSIYCLNPSRVASSTRPLVHQSRDALIGMLPELARIDPGILPVILIRGRRPTRLWLGDRRRDEIAILTPAQVAKIARYLDWADEAPVVGAPIPSTSPYDEVISRGMSNLVSIILRWSPDQDPSELAQEVGMVFPPSIVHRNAYFIHNLRDYDEVMVPSPQVPEIDGMPAQDTLDLIRIYTDEALLSGYDIEMSTWESRLDLLERIASQARASPRWSFRSRRCNNLNRSNPITLDEPRVDDPDDPIVSYGGMTTYRCYNISELMESFRSDPDIGFVFGVPDWISPQGIRAMGGQVGYPLPPAPDFTVSSLRQLEEVLTQANQPMYQDLIQTIRTGLAAKNAATAVIRRLRNDYMSMGPSERRTVLNYVMYLFLLGMYMRFWLGPGSPYPVEWVENGSSRLRCTVQIRDENTNLVLAERPDFFDVMAPSIREWVLDLPRIKYDFKTGAVSLGLEKLEFILRQVERGDFCLAEASDHLLRTSYYLAITVLDLSNPDFNQHIDDILELQQPPFVPEEVVESYHRDPNYTLLEDNPEMESPDSDATRGDRLNGVN